MDLRGHHPSGTSIRAFSILGGFVFVAGFVVAEYYLVVRAISENPNIRISARSKESLRELAKRVGKPMQAVLDEAVEQYRQDQFFREAEESYARLQNDPKVWKDHVSELELWSGTVDDGLERECGGRGAGAGAGGDLACTVRSGGGARTGRGAIESNDSR